MSARSASLRSLVLAFGLLASAASARAQDGECGEWTPGLFPLPRFDAPVHSLGTFLAPSGPVLVAGGEFTIVYDVLASGLVQTDGRRFAPLGPGVGAAPRSTAVVRAVQPYDDGDGEALYVAGTFASAGGLPVNFFAKWDGMEWHDTGSMMDRSPVDLVVFDDGTGPALYAGGNFSTVAGMPIRGIARFDGENWSAVGGGVDGTVRSLAVHDDGSGPALFVSGIFNSAGGGVAASKIAKWDGAAWSALGAGLDREASAMLSYDPGSGAELFAVGEFSYSGSASLRYGGRWDGSSWRKIGEGLEGGFPSDNFHALAVFDDGTGPQLYVGAKYLFFSGGETYHSVARFDGSVWSALPGDVQPGFVKSLHVFDDGTGPELWAGGELTLGANLARFDGTGWRSARPSAAGIPEGVGNVVQSLAAFDDGSGTALFAGGGFLSIGGAPESRGVARFDGAAWTGTAFPSVERKDFDAITELAVVDEGSALALYAARYFFTEPTVLRFNGASWSTLPRQFERYPVRALVGFDDGSGPSLYAGGEFNVNSGAVADYVARFDGTTWSEVGGGLSGPVFALAVFDAGSGPELYAAGTFLDAGGSPASRIAKWDGVSWSEVAGGIGGLESKVGALTVFDDGSGPMLYAGGRFESAGGVPAASVARFDGVSWSPVGAGLAGSVSALEPFDDGTGPVLVAGGYFESSGPVTGLGNVSQWDGSRWRPLWTGFEGSVTDLASLEENGQAVLYAAGHFTQAGGNVSNSLARWARNDTSCRLGNVGTGGGAAPIDVLFVNGVRGSASCRRVIVTAGEEVPISVVPSGGLRHFALWTLDGAPRPSDAAPVEYRAGDGTVVSLGTGCFPLPTGNLVTPGSVLCPLARPLGVTSRRMGALTAATLCLDGRNPLSRAPVSFTARFPAGNFTLGGVIADPGSAAARPVSLMNWVIVTSQ